VQETREEKPGKLKNRREKETKRRTVQGTREERPEKLSNRREKH